VVWIEEGSPTVPSLVGGDETEILTLSFGAFTDTSTDTALDLMRGTNTLVAFLELDSHYGNYVRERFNLIAKQKQRNVLPTASPIP
jgi:hypothetical protein